MKALRRAAPTNIVLAAGTYDNAEPFRNAHAHRLYAQQRGRAILRAGVAVGGNHSNGGALLRGLAFNISDSSKTTNGAVVYTWGVAGANAQILDCRFQGNWAVAYGVNARNPQGLVVERSRFFHFTDVGLRASDNVKVAYGAATPHIAKINDIYVDGVSRAVPGASNGTAEAGIWIGHPVDNGVHRIKIKDVSRKAVEVVNNSRDTLFTDLDLDMRGNHQSIGVGVYMEHNTYYNVFDRFVMIGVGRGFNGEWNEGIPGNAGAQHITIRNGVIDAAGWLLPGNTAGVYLDEGSDSNTVTGVTFKNQNWAGVGAYKNIGTNSFSGNTYQMLPGAVPYSTAHLYSG